jgi:hypothetical protein
MNNGTGMDNGSAMANGSDMSGMANASLRIAHMSPDAPAVDVYLDNQTAVSGVESSQITDYLTVPAGQHTVTITAADNRSAVVFNGTVPLGTSAYTVTATGEVGPNASQPFAPLVLNDNTTAPGENTSKVRLVHAVPDAPPVDVTVEGTNTTLFDNVTYSNATDYAAVPGGEYTLEIRPATANNNGPIVTTVDVDLENGMTYTAFAAGYLDPANACARSHSTWSSSPIAASRIPDRNRSRAR